jgi:hypothetical protein
LMWVGIVGGYIIQNKYVTTGRQPTRHTCVHIHNPRPQKPKTKATRTLHVLGEGRDEDRGRPQRAGALAEGVPPRQGVALGPGQKPLLLFFFWGG